MKFLNKLSLHYKYFISYTIILSIPLILIGGIIYQYFIETVRSEVIKNNKQMLSQVQYNLDVKMDELEKIAFQISLNNQLTPYRVTRDGYWGRQALQELNKYKTGNSFIYDLVLYYDQQPLVFSSYSTYQTEEFMEGLFGYPSWNEDQFRQDILRNSLSKVYAPQQMKLLEDNQFITYLVPIPKSATSYGAVMFFIKASSVQLLIQNILEDDGKATFVLDREGKLINTTEPGSVSQMAVIAPYLQAEADEGTMKLPIKEVNFLVSYTKSPRNGWTYVTLVEEDKIMTRVVWIKKIALLSLAATFLLGLGLSYLFMKLNYSPIRKLRQFIESETGEPLQQHGNEFEAFRHVVRQMSSKNRSMQSQITFSRPVLRNFYLHELLRGNIEELSKLNWLVNETGIYFDFDWFRTVILQLDTSEESIQELLPHMARKLEAELDQEHVGYALDTWETNKIVFIISSESDSPVAFLKQMEKLQLALRTEWQVHATIGVGNAYAKPSEIGKSYIEANTALDYRLIRGKRSIIFIHEAVEGDKALQTVNEMENIRLYIHRGEIDQLSNYLSELIREIKAKHVSLFVVRSICYDLIHLIATTLNELQQNDHYEAMGYPDVITLLDYETIDELSDMITTISIRICRHIEESKNRSSVQWKNELVAYVNSQFTNPQFSLQLMAEQFSVTPPYLSRIFKEETGKTLTQYVNWLRMEKVKKMLADGEDNLQELVEKVGYANVSSFIRKFKESEGITPGDYRKIYTK
ncbi:helix-turn-helix domain-containing protein [Paenibacillus cymbidii]|uniref:helix-turn-helix domain-containing protein n=1 Tax=Paenibacillus cymbidii TaxID=1639034 RepID=UPI001436B891|nr:helix-turn-helix domain-containing protein [Paenibacillus cymbidii]